MTDAPTLTSDELTEMQARVDAATSGPWEAGVGGGMNPDFPFLYVQQVDDDGSMVASLDFEREADAAFIAHAREDVPRLLAAARAGLALRQASREYAEAVAQEVHTWDQRHVDGKMSMKAYRAAHHELIAADRALLDTALSAGQEDVHEQH